jgi:polyisoprenoid-binding protein YceI
MSIVPCPSFDLPTDSESSHYPEPTSDEHLKPTSTPMRLITFALASCSPLPRTLRVGVCLLSCLLFCRLPLAQPQAHNYRLDPAHTRVHWEVLHFGTSTTRGRFDDIGGSLTLAADGTGRVSIVVAPGSVNTGVPPLDGVLRRSYLATTDFPQAYFVASGWKWKVDAPLDVTGELTLHGVSRPLRLRAAALRCQPHPTLGRELCGADLEGELLRSDFGITDGLPFIGDRVRLVIQVEALRESPPN